VPAWPWIDPNRTQHNFGRGRSADRLKGKSKEEETLPPPELVSVRPPVASSAHRRAVRGGRWRGRLRLGFVLAAVLGLAGGAATAWYSGWRPSFLEGTASKVPEEIPAKISETKPEVKPVEPPAPSPPAIPPTMEIPRSCFTEMSEVRVGAASCGFALDPSGALSFQGNQLIAGTAAGNIPAQRLMLYPFSPSGRFVFLRACQAASGGRCEAQHLVDTKGKKLFELKVGGDGFSWVAWSPDEQIGLLAWRDHLSDTIAVVSTADGNTIVRSAIRTVRNRYALVRAGSVRWRDDRSFTVEVKLCRPDKGRYRSDCEKDDDVKYRRRIVKFKR
jgi:hypothetical protein